jgi:benzoyl-CoA reductase subunit C
MLSAVLFPSTCDVIRNLSGIWKLLYPDVYVRYIDVPQVPDPVAAAHFWEGELRRLLRDLSKSRATSRATNLHRSPSIMKARNHPRPVPLRQERPWDVPTEELYLLMRAGEVIPPDEFIGRARDYLAAVEAEPRRPRDNSRVVITGAFCEQPPLGLIKSIERAGCYIVDDDFLLGNRFLTGEVPLDGDPVRALAESFVHNELRTSSCTKATRRESDS